MQTTVLWDQWCHLPSMKLENYKPSSLFLDTGEIKF